MRKIGLLMIGICISAATFVGCGKGNRNPIKGSWKVKEASAASDPDVSYYALGATYTFNDDQMVYKNSEFAVDSGVSEMKLIDKTHFETYNREFDIRTSYEFEVRKSGKELVIKSDNGYNFVLEKIR